MAEVTKQDRDALGPLFERYLSEHGEPGSASLVATLTDVAMGYLAQSFGLLPPVPRETEREQLAAYLVATYFQGTRPSPTNIYLSQLRHVANSYLDKVRPAVPVAPDAITTLATLAMGHTKETDPRPTRMAATVKLIDLYLEGRVSGR